MSTAKDLLDCLPSSDDVKRRISLNVREYNLLKRLLKLVEVRRKQIGELALQSTKKNGDSTSSVAREDLQS